MKSSTLLFFPGLILACVSDTPVDRPDVNDAAISDTSLGADTSTVADTGASSDVVTCTSPKQICGTTCADLANDDGNCGTCGHSCKGDGCDKGACKPFDLLTGIDSPSAIAQNPTFPLVFVGANDRILKCSKTGCGNSPIPVWSSSTYTIAPGARIAVSNSSVATTVRNASNASYLGYFGAAAATTTVPTVVTLSGVLYPIGLAAFEDDDTFAFEWNYGARFCPSSAFGCSSPTSLDGDDGETAIATRSGSPGYIAWTTFSGISYVAKTSLTTVKQLVTSGISNAQISFMTISATKLYWVAQASSKFQIYSCPFPSGCAQGTLLVDGETAIDGFAADDDAMYWTQGAAAVVRACFDTTKGCGTASINLATNQAVPTGIVLDKDYVFWTQKGGSANQGKVTRLVR